MSAKDDTNIESFEEWKRMEAEGFASFQDAYDAGKASALAQLAGGKSILMMDEMGLSELDFARALGWNSVFDSLQHGKPSNESGPA